MNGYIALFNDERAEIYAESLYAAKLKALDVFKPRKSQAHMVSVHLAEIDGKPYVHTATD